MKTMAAAYFLFFLPVFALAQSPIPPGQPPYQFGLQPQQQQNQWFGTEQRIGPYGFGNYRNRSTGETWNTQRQQIGPFEYQPSPKPTVSAPLDTSPVDTATSFYAHGTWPAVRIKLAGIPIGFIGIKR